MGSNAAGAAANARAPAMGEPRTSRSTELGKDSRSDQSHAFTGHMFDGCVSLRVHMCHRSFRKRGAKDNTRYNRYIIPGDLWLSSYSMKSRLVKRPPYNGLL